MSAERRGRRTVLVVSATRQPSPEERDDRVSLPLDPETVLRALLRVDPAAPPVNGDGDRYTDDEDPADPAGSSSGG